MKITESNKRSKAVYAGVIIILCIFFVVGFIYGLDSVLKMEGAFPPPELTESLTPVPQTPEEAFDYLTHVLENALAGKPKFSADASFSIDGDSLETQAPDTVKETLLFVKDDFDDHINGKFQSSEADFSEGFASLLRMPTFQASDITGFTCEYIYYKCASCGETSNDPQTECEYCGSEIPYIIQYRDNYTITLDLNVTEDILDRNFTVRTHEEIREMFGDELNGIADLKPLDVDYKTLSVRFSVRRTTDELQSLEYIKKMNVKANAAFKADYEPIGELDFSVDVTEKEGYSFTWPAITLSAHVKDMEPKGSDNLLATLTCDDPTKYDAVWSSSDENVVTVDEEGYLKASKTPGTAIITATFEFKGKTYTDTCVINVKNDVESIALNRRKITVQTGDTYQLTAKVSPKKATIQTVKWYSEDESIATVDENGKVTAVAPGTVVVYALSDDLYYKSSCEVTVK